MLCWRLLHTVRKETADIFSFIHLFFSSFVGLWKVQWRLKAYFNYMQYEATTAYYFNNSTLWIVLIIKRASCSEDYVLQLSLFLWNLSIFWISTVNFYLKQSLKWIQWWNIILKLLTILLYSRFLFCLHTTWDRRLQIKYQISKYVRLYKIYKIANLEPLFMALYIQCTCAWLHPYLFDAIISQSVLLASVIFSSKGKNQCLWCSQDEEITLLRKSIFTWPGRVSGSTTCYDWT